MKKAVITTAFLRQILKTFNQSMISGLYLLQREANLSGYASTLAKTFRTPTKTLTENTETPTISGAEGVKTP
jgi:hypothetical protein